MVTVELAFASLGAAAGLVLFAWVLTVVMMLGQCNDLATAVARQEARGDGPAVSRVLAAKPPAARVKVDRQGTRIRVSVAWQARPWADWLPAVPLTAQAVVEGEPT